MKNAIEKNIDEEVNSIYKKRPFLFLGTLACAIFGYAKIVESVENYVIEKI